MLGSVHESKPSDEGDLDPRALAAVAVASGLMVLAIGLGMLLTGSDTGTAESTPIVPAPSRPATMVRPSLAPIAVAPPGIALPPAVDAGDGAPLLPAPPHPVELPILLP